MFTPPPINTLVRETFIAVVPLSIASERKERDARRPRLLGARGPDD